MLGRYSKNTNKSWCCEYFVMEFGSVYFQSTFLITAVITSQFLDKILKHSVCRKML